MMMIKRGKNTARLRKLLHDAFMQSREWSEDDWGEGSQLQISLTTSQFAAEIVSACLMTLVDNLQPPDKKAILDELVSAHIDFFVDILKSSNNKVSDYFKDIKYDYEPH